MLFHYPAGCCNAADRGTRDNVPLCESLAGEPVAE